MLSDLDYVLISCFVFFIIEFARQEIYFLHKTALLCSTNYFLNKEIKTKWDNKVISSLILIGLWCAVGIGSIQRHTCSVNDNINCSKVNCNHIINFLNYQYSALLSFFHWHGQDPTGYTAAVVEYKPIPIGNQSALETVLSNVREYVKLIEDASVHVS